MLIILAIILVAFVIGDLIYKLAKKLHAGRIVKGIFAVICLIIMKVVIDYLAAGYARHDPYAMTWIGMFLYIIVPLSALYLGKQVLIRYKKQKGTLETTTEEETKETKETE
jgi:DNA integrity scanning protein DisA with diadenylate cyclase activity